MGIELLKKKIEELITFWKNQNIETHPNSIESINRVERENGLMLPTEFKELYSAVNGMPDLYPNYLDKEGFLFYPIEAVVRAEKELEGFHGSNLYLFAEFMHCSWWYGVEVAGESQYVIGIIPDDGVFTPITHSLADFITMYIQDSPKLYEYQI